MSTATLRCLVLSIALVQTDLAPPVRLTAEEDRRRMMDLLRITSIPPGASGSSPATYDEATANPYPVLPDPLRLKSGKKVTTGAQWRTRRAELVDDFARVGGDIGFRQHTGGHTTEPTWPTFLTFASRYLGSK